MSELASQLETQDQNYTGALQSLDKLTKRRMSIVQGLFDEANRMSETSGFVNAQHVQSSLQNANNSSELRQPLKLNRHSNITIPEFASPNRTLATFLAKEKYSKTPSLVMTTLAPPSPHLTKSKP